MTQAPETTTRNVLEVAKSLRLGAVIQHAVPLIGTKHNFSERVFSRHLHALLPGRLIPASAHFIQYKSSQRPFLHSGRQLAGAFASRSFIPAGAI